MQLDLDTLNMSGDISNYQPNGEFVLEGFVPERHIVYYSCCEEPYIDITYSIRLRRRPMFYVFNLILPCILINGIGKGKTLFIKPVSSVNQNFLANTCCLSTVAA